MEQNHRTSSRVSNRPRPIVLSASLFLLPIFFLMGFGSAWLIWGKNAEIQQQVAAAQETGSDTIQRINVSLDDDPSFGPDNAPITIVEFSDYQCPFCERWHQETFKALLDAYPDQIRFVYRDFPLYNLHPEAEPAAIAANCANEQGNFWDYHELLFSGAQDLGKNAYLAYADELGLDTTAFAECINSQRYLDEVTSDYEYALSLGINSTPTFYVNGILLVGAQPLDIFKQLIDLELAGEIP